MKKQQGFLIILAIALILLIGFIGVAATYLFSSNSRSGSDHYQSAQAFYLATAGLEDATHQLLAPNIADRTPCNGLSIANAALGAGGYLVTSSGAPSSPTGGVTTINMTSPLSATATTITVLSTANYQPSGRIMIDKELMNYTGTNGTQFTGITRGVDGTPATTHVTGTVAAGGAAIGQYQCNINSSLGGVPTTTSPTGVNAADPYGKRNIAEAVQLQEAFAVGVNTANYGIAHWNRDNATGGEVIWNSLPTLAGAQTLNSVSMISYADGWAVGNARIFLHWSGNAWTSVATTVPNLIYNGVYCNASNDCHAVGNASGTIPAIVNWNGTTWSQTTSITGGVDNDLYAINCDRSTDCWAVGDRAGANNVFYHWTGSWSTSNPGGLTGNIFKGVFCNSTTDCWAVGANNTFAHYNGAWSNSVATGMPSVNYNGIFCNSTTDCWVVGVVNAAEDLILHWNGTAWSRFAAPTTGTANLLSVTCATPTDCWAVGAAKAFLHYNGTTWINVPAGITTNAPNVQYNSVSIVTPTGQPQAAWNEN